MSNHITIELCAEDRQRIDELIAFAGLIASEMKSKKPVNMIDPATIVAPAEVSAESGTFADRLREAMDNAGVKQIDLVRETGLDKGAVSSYLAGKYEPKQKAVMAMANYLNVSELWLLGYDVPKTIALAGGHPDPVGEPGPAGVDGVAEPEQPKYTKEDIMAKVQALAAPNNPKREQAKAIVKSYGAKVSDIPEDKYNEVMDKLVELEG